jgi:hypothetical protein
MGGIARGCVDTEDKTRLWLGHSCCDFWRGGIEQGGGRRRLLCLPTQGFVLFLYFTTKASSSTSVLHADEKEDHLACNNIFCFVFLKKLQGVGINQYFTSNTQVIDQVCLSVCRRHVCTC